MNISLWLHDIRSCHNVGSVFRSADAFGVTEIYLSGYTPAPHFKNDTRLPHIADRANHQIAKTALGAEKTVPFTVFPNDLDQAIKKVKQKYHLIAMELTTNSKPLQNVQMSSDTCLAVGAEIGGLPQKIISACDVVAQVDMNGIKESLNVSVAAAIGLYQLTRVSVDEPADLKAQ